jgi:Zinc knuckle
MSKNLYEDLKIILNDCVTRESNFRKSGNHKFQTSFLVNSRGQTVRRKIRALEITKRLLKVTKNPELQNKIISKKKLIISLSNRIFLFIRNRLPRHKNEPTDCSEFVAFFQYIDNIKMAAYEYKEAKHLPELKDVRNNTSIRDFISTITAYHDELNEEGKVRLVQFLINAKILGTAKTKLGPGTAIATLAQLKTALYERCGSKETYESLREKLNDVQLRDGSLENMASDVNEIAERIMAIEVQRQGENAAPTIRSLVLRDALLIFKKRLPERLKLVVEAARPTSVEEALTVASAAAAGADKEEVALLWGEPSRKPNARGKHNVICYNCQNKGHFANECRKKKEVKNSSEGSRKARQWKKKGRRSAYVGAETSSSDESDENEEEKPTERSKAKSSKKANGDERDF